MTDFGRRQFIKKTLLTGASLSFGLGARAGELSLTDSSISILHTNDMHSRIEPFPDDGGRWANSGGMTKLSGLVAQIRRQEEHVLLLDAGDVFQGTPYFNFYGGELEFKLMSKMGYDASTLGNHEFDNGLEGFVDMLPHADFSHIISNYETKGTILQENTLPYKIFKKGKMRIGVFGLGIELHGLVAEKDYAGVKYKDPVSVAKEMVQELRRQKCHLVICLSHLGYQYRTDKIDDLKLAAAVPGMDLIIGGHTHTFLEEASVVMNPEGKPTLVNQVGTGAVKLGKVDFSFSKDEKIKLASVKSMSIY